MPTDRPDPARGPADPIPDGAVPASSVHPDLLAWARQTLDMEEFLADVREVRATGGRTFEEVIAAVEAGMREP